MKKTLAERFWAKVNKYGPLPSPYVVKFYRDIEGQRCWEWTASLNHKGYGNFGIETEDGWRIEKAHRVAWFLETGRWPVPCGLHKCDNGSCVRFSHLYEGSTGDNNREREAKGRSNHPIGEMHHQAKLSNAAVRRIHKALCHNTRGMQARLARVYGVSKTTITNMKLNRVRRTK
jgi:hypothetical protein